MLVTLLLNDKAEYLARLCLRAGTTFSCLVAISSSPWWRICLPTGTRAKHALVRLGGSSAWKMYGLSIWRTTYLDQTLQPLGWIPQWCDSRRHRGRDLLFCSKQTCNLSTLLLEATLGMCRWPGPDSQQDCWGKTNVWHLKWSSTETARPH